jgi:hypothetical protein
VCAAQELRKGSPTILVLDAPDTWIDKSVPSIDFAPVAHLQSDAPPRLQGRSKLTAEPARLCACTLQV